MRQNMQQLIDVARDEGLEMRLFDTVHTNTIDAHRLLHLALEVGGATLQRELKEALLSAYFLRAEDVGDHEVLVAAGDAYGDAVQADVAQARAYGATGVSFFVVDQRYGVSGAQPTEVSNGLLEQAWAESHPLLQPVGGDAEGCGPDGCAVPGPQPR